GVLDDIVRATSYGIAEARQVGQQQRGRIAFGVGRNGGHHFAGEAVEDGIIEHRPRFGRIGGRVAASARTRSRARSLARASSVAAYVSISAGVFRGGAGVVALALRNDTFGRIFLRLLGIVGHAALPRTMSLKSFTLVGVSSCTEQPALAAVWPQHRAAARPASSLSARTISCFTPRIGG